jgi:hypothetical protein
MSKSRYVPPTITAVGSLHELTLVGSNKYATLTPDGVLYHPVAGPPVPLTS